jgi:hypothetical protein
MIEWLRKELALVRPRQYVARAVVALSLGGVAPSAMAADGQAPGEAALQAAREQFGQARALEDEGRWAEALAVFQRVGTVKMTPQVRFHIALCMEKVGALADALALFQTAAGEALSSAPDVVTEANQHIRDLEQRTPTLTVTVSGGAPGDEVMLDGTRIPPMEPLKANPGPHTVAVRRGGRVVIEERVVLSEGKPQTIEIKAPGGEGESKADPGRMQRTLGWTAVGVSAASFVGMGVFIGLRAKAIGDLSAQCPTFTGCDPSVEPIVRQGQTTSTLVNVFAGVGGVAAASGVVLLLTAPAPPRRAPASVSGLRVLPAVGPNGAFVLLEGGF